MGLAFPTPYGGHVRARIAVTEEVIGGTVGAMPRPPETVVAGIEAVVEHDTTVGCAVETFGCNSAGIALTIGTSYEHATMSGCTGDAVRCNSVAIQEVAGGMPRPPEVRATPTIDQAEEHLVVACDVIDSGWEASRAPENLDVAMPRPPVVITITNGAFAAVAAVEVEAASGMPRPPEAAGADGNESSKEGRSAGYFIGTT